MTTTTYYNILGVSEDASKQEIKAAYRELAKQYHPDHSDAPNADQHFKQIKTAKEVLTNPDSRAEYDQTSHEEFINHSTNNPLITGAAGNVLGDTATDQTLNTTTTTTPDTSSDSQHQDPAYANSSLRDRLLGNGIGVGTTLVWLLTLLRQFAYGTRWVVETLWTSLHAIPYGTLSLLTSLFFLAGVAAETTLYITIPSAIIFLSIWAYMIMDWELGVGGFGFSSLVLGLGHNQGFIPGGDGFKIIMTALLAALILSFLMKVNYDARNANPPSVMDKLAGWDVNNDTESSD